MIDDELLNKFNNIEDLPVSEEMLGAYLEGKLQKVELDALSEQISSDYSINEILNNVTETNVENLVEASYPWDVYKGDYGYWELGLSPAITQAEFEMIANNLQNSLTPSFQEEPISDIDRENLCVFDDSFADESHSIEENNNNLDFSDEYDNSDDFESNV